MDELRSEDVQLRLNAIHRISTIALALGPDRAREELIVFLQESVDDEDEVLLALAEELGRDFEGYIGGKEFAHLLLGPLENLSAVEETVVRDKVRVRSMPIHFPPPNISRVLYIQATESITKVAAVLSKPQIEQYYIPLVQRLSRGEWFTSRTSACALYTPVYDKVDPAVQDEMRKAFATLGSDDTPMVRRAAAKWLGVSDNHTLPLSVVVDLEHATTGLREKTDQTTRPFRRSGGVQETPIGRPGLGSTPDRGRSYRNRSTADAG